MFWKVLASIMVAGGITLAAQPSQAGYAAADSATAAKFYGKPEYFKSLKRRFESCNWRTNFGDCKGMMPGYMAGLILNKDYKTAIAQLPNYYRAVTADGGRTPVPCPSESHYESIVYKIDNYPFLNLGYYETAYFLYKQTSSDLAKRYALRAHLCANYRMGFNQGNNPTYHNFYKFNSKTFASDIENIHKSSSEYDIDLFLSDVVSKINETSASIKKKYPGFIKEYSTNMAAMYRNASARVQQIGLHKDFYEFYKELEKYEVEAARESQKAEKYVK